LGASSDQPVNSNERINNRRRSSKKTKVDDTNQSNEDNEEWNGLGNLDNDEEAKNKNQKKVYPLTFPIKIRKPVEKEIFIEDPTQVPPIPGIPIEPLSQQKRQPAQERLFNELNSINERIASLIQVRQMGLSTPENKKQLKQLIKDRNSKAFALKRLQSKQRSSNSYRIKKKQIVIFFSSKSSCFSSFFCNFRLNIYLKQNQNYIHN
jgi:hypothetical protein